ncbi:hypothetical protein Golob_000022, partial [Gossypium lobatum]|nr:hypothetical protein [Gossypium lobatum]
ELENRADKKYLSTRCCGANIKKPSCEDRTRRSSSMERRTDRGVLDDNLEDFLGFYPFLCQSQNKEGSDKHSLPQSIHNMWGCLPGFSIEVMKSSFNLFVIAFGSFGLAEIISFMKKDSSQDQKERGKSTSIHFDAAYERLGFRSASGIIVRNKNREILASQPVIHSNIADSFTVEAYAGLQAIKLGIRLGVNKLTVLGDSKTVIKKCQSFFSDKSVIGAIITDIQSLKNRFQEIKFTFVPREQNIYAHTIAKEALRRGESFYLEKEVPEVVRRT